MMNVSLLLHVLAAAVLIGMYIPELLLKKVYNTGEQSSDARLALARLHLRLMIWFFPVLILTVLLGVGRTFEMDYPWFNFSLTLWLTLKQGIGIFMLLGYATHYPKMLSVNKTLSTQSLPADERLQAYTAIRGKAHPFIMLAWVMAIFGVIKF